MVISELIHQLQHLQAIKGDILMVVDGDELWGYDDFKIKEVSIFKNENAPRYEGRYDEVFDENEGKYQYKQQALCLSRCKSEEQS